MSTLIHLSLKNLLFNFNILSSTTYKMLKAFFIVFLSTSFAVTVLEGCEIRLETGKSLYFKSIDSENQSYVESHLKCSTKCASACLTFSQGQATLQCTTHCGCAALISSSAESLRTITELAQSDVTIDIFYPQSSEQATEIFVQDNSSTTRISVEENSQPGYYEVDVGVNNNRGDPYNDEVDASAGIASDGETTVAGAGYETPRGEEASIYVYHYENSTYDPTDGSSQSISVDYVTSYTQDGDGNDQTNYMDEYSYTYSDGENVTYYEYLGGEVNGDGFSYVKYGSGTEDVAGNGSGTSSGYVYWWVNSQGMDGGSEGMGWFSAILVGFVLLVVGAVAYRKYTEAKAKRYSFTDSGSQQSYIRI
jgi:hypothetical protein